MIFENEKQILKIIKYTPSLFVLIISLIIIIIQFNESNKKFEKEKIQQEYIQKNKKLIKQRVYEVYNYIKREQRNTELELKNSLQVAINNAFAIANTLYENNKDKNTYEIKKLITDALRNIRFNNKRGYFFIYENSGRNILLPHNKHLEGKSFWDHKDAKGTPIIQKMTSLLRKKDETFYEWYWFDPTNPDKQRKKIGLIKNFKPFNWFIGTGEYIEEYEKEVKEKLLKNIREIRFGNNGYIFIINYDSIYLSHIRKNFIGKKAVTNKDTIAIKKVIKDLIKISKKGEGYYNYVQSEKPGTKQATEKASFVKGLNNWQWMIGTGFYLDDMKKQLFKKKLN
jgi:two-component system NtrC family sensor kinase